MSRKQKKPRSKLEFLVNFECQNKRALRVNFKLFKFKSKSVTAGQVCHVTQLECGQYNSVIFGNFHLAT